MRISKTNPYSMGGKYILGGAGILLLLLLFYACTDNPLGEKLNGQNKSSIRGHLETAGGEDSSVVIWLEGLNISSKPGIDGEFDLVLPQGGSTETGAFDIYFYIENYTLHRSPVFVREGEFLYSEGAVDTKGNIKEAIVLEPLLGIHTELSHFLWAETDTVDLTITVTLQAFSTPLTLRAESINGNFLASFVIIQDDGTGAYENELGFVSNEPASLKIEAHTTLNVTRNFRLLPSFLTPGKKRVVPYIWLERNDIPAALTSFLGAERYMRTPNYTKIPLVRSGGEFEVERKE